MFKLLLSKKIIGISSGGGHLTELRKCVLGLDEVITYITFDNGHTRKSLEKEKAYYIIDPHTNYLYYIFNGFQSLIIYFRIRPFAIISTGAGIAIPILLIGKFFGSKIIYIETGARVTSKSRSGKFMYNYADLFIVQHEPLLEKYPRAILGGIF